MSELSQHSHNRRKKEHNTTASYIVGILLSLVFTAIPYYLVVTKTISGSRLLETIITFAVLQMAIQIFFFLHLGRGPKPLYNVVFFVSTVGIIMVVVVGSIFIINNLYNTMVPTQVTTKLAQDEGISQIGGEQTGACQEIHANHKVIIKNKTVTPTHIEAGRCDSLTFINEDDAVHTIAFGSYPEHQTYGGESDMTVRKGYPKTINLNQSGTYLFHDNIEPKITGNFTVAQ